MIERNLSSAWQKNEPVRIKQKGLMALTSVAILHDKKMASVDNRCIWPSSLATANDDNRYLSRKLWKF